MPTTTFESVNLAANSKSTNLMSGDINEFVSYRAQINIYAVTSAVGANMTILADNDVVMDDKELNFIATTIDKSAHLIDSFVVNPGTRLAIFVRETAGVASTDIIGIVDVVPV